MEIRCECGKQVRILEEKQHPDVYLVTVEPCECENRAGNWGFCPECEDLPPLKQKLEHAKKANQYLKDQWNKSSAKELRLEGMLSTATRTCNALRAQLKRILENGNTGKNS